MANLKRLGDAVVIKTSLTHQELRVVGMLAPSLLNYNDPETKETLFAIAVDEDGQEFFSPNGIVFGDKNYVTVAAASEEEDTALEFGKELLYLNQIEEQIKKFLKSKDLKAIEDSVEIVEV